MYASLFYGVTDGGVQEKERDFGLFWGRVGGGSAYITDFARLLSSRIILWFSLLLLLLLLEERERKSSLLDTFE